MPAYDYRCTACDERFEVTRSSSDAAEVRCPSCGGPTKRVFTPLGVHFKGTGFHNTDYRKPAPAESAPSESAPSEAPSSEAPSCPSPSSSCESCPAAQD